ncbi:MAG: MoaD/ThiS family protein [Chloroflexi bacterium]|nr:MoaD/ThiS family protein [Chloroflexota bacterium]
MKISLKFIATYRKYLPPTAKGSVYEMEVAAGITATALLAQFGVPLGNASVILVNGRAPDADYALQEGDVVAAFPAVGGG